MMPSNPYICSDGGGGNDCPSMSDGTPQGRNPLLCFVCNDYYSEPCLLACYHTFCGRCLRGRIVDGKIQCPLCSQPTQLKDSSSIPPSDLLMRQLIDLANTENPPCSNCDKRDRASMYFCSTCGQALCNNCRENTHRAKMFSTHDIVHMSKCSNEVHRRCGVHGEQYIMFSMSQRNMLCVNCFRDTPAEARLHCVDIDTAYSQCSKKLENSLLAVRDIQTSVHEGVMSYRNLLEELQRNTDTEKMTIHSFCQGMQEAINKTQNSMALEVQRQFEGKERLFKTSLISMSTVLPILQLHLMLCQSFMSSANKFQFLDLAYPMMDRLASVSQLSQPIKSMQSSQIRTNYRSEFAHSLEPWIGKLAASHHQRPAPPAPNPETQGPMQGQGSGDAPGGPSAQTPSRKQHSALKAKALDGEGPFSNHCRSFDTQMKELGMKMNNVRERLCDLQRDVTVMRRAATPPLAKRHLSIARDCERLDDTLQRYHVELDRLRSVFETLWQEQLYRIHVEQDIFRTQMTDIVSLRAEVKQLAHAAQQLEPYIKSLSQTNLSDVANLQTLIDRINVMQQQAADPHFRIEPLLKSQDFRDPPQVVSPSSEDMMFLKGEGSKMEVPVRESSRMRTHNASNMMDCQLYGRGQSDGRSRNVISQLIEKVRTKEDRKKSPVQEDIRTPLQRERSKSEGRTKDGIHGHGKGEPYRASSGPAGGGKVSSLYHTISGKVLGSRDSGCNEVGGIPPPPPSRRSEDPQQPMLNVSSKIDHAIALNKIREHLENHLKQKIKQRNQSASRTQLYRDGVDEEEGQYQRIAEATSQPGSSVMTEAMVHSKPASPPARRPHPRPHPHSHPVYPHSDTEDSVFYPDTPSSGFSSRCQISLSYDFPFGHSRSVADDWTSTCWGI